MKKFKHSEITPEEIYNKRNSWYDTTGNFIGKLWNVNGKQLIINK